MSALSENLIDHSDSSDRISDIFKNNNFSSATDSGTESTCQPGTYKKDPWDWLFVNKDDNEEETSLYRVEALQAWWWKKYILVPFLTIVTLGFIILVMYWYPNIKASLMFNKWVEIRSKATYMLITGYKDHKEIVEINFRESTRNPILENSPFEAERSIPRKFANQFSNFIF